MIVLKRVIETHRYITIFINPWGPWPLTVFGYEPKTGVTNRGLQPPEDGGVRKIERLCRHKIEKERGKDVHPTPTSLASFVNPQAA